MKKIFLDIEEFSYLKSTAFIPLSILQSIERVDKKKNCNYILIISDIDADIIRDRFGEQLQLTGFDENYALTEEGQILENLIDKFF